MDWWCLHWGALYLGSWKIINVWICKQDGDEDLDSVLSKIIFINYLYQLLVITSSFYCVAKSKCVLVIYFNDVVQLDPLRPGWIQEGLFRDYWGGCNQKFSENVAFSLNFYVQTTRSKFFYILSFTAFLLNALCNISLTEN